MPFLRKDQIEAKCKILLERIGYKEGPLLLESIYQKEVDTSSLEVRVMEDDTNDHLGTISFFPTIIKIFKDQKSQTRQKFTLAHELGHFYLGHAEFMSGEYCEESDYTPLDAISGGIKEIARMEWQANYFASCLILPREPLLDLFARLLVEHDLKDHGFGYLFVDDQPVNTSTYMSITSVLKKVFDVSHSAVTLRLQMLGLLNDQRGRKPNKRKSVKLLI